jgi:hypothetical protein
VFCPNCGSQVPDGTRFCADCGEALFVASSAPPAANRPAKRSRLPLVLVLALIAAGVAVYLATKDGDEKVSTPTIADASVLVGDWEFTFTIQTNSYQNQVVLTSLFNFNERNPAPAAIMRTARFNIDQQPGSINAVFPGPVSGQTVVLGGVLVGNSIDLSCNPCLTSVNDAFVITGRVSADGKTFRGTYQSRYKALERDPVDEVSGDFTATRR